MEDLREGRNETRVKEEEETWGRQGGGEECRIKGRIQ